MTNIITSKCKTCGVEYKKEDTMSDFFAEPLDPNKVYRGECDECKAKNLAEMAKDPRVQVDMDAIAEKEMNDCILIRKVK
jgi:hypothetical protein